MLARHRLEEAQFFLEKAESCDTNVREIRYYMNAFLSAARSVTWVLQAELRPRYGQEFDEWYLSKKESLGADPIAGMVKNARNVSQKQGSRLPGISYTWRNPANLKESLTVRISNPFEVNEFVISVDSAKEPSYAVTIDPDKPLEAQLEQVDDQVAEQLMARLPDILDRRGRLLREVEPEMLVSLMNEDPVSLRELIRSLREYVQSLARVIDESENQFPMYRV